MADISTEAEARAAIAAGGDIVGTTMSGYTGRADAGGPDLGLVGRAPAWALPCSPKGATTRRRSPPPRSGPERRRWSSARRSPGPSISWAGSARRLRRRGWPSGPRWPSTSAGARRWPRWSAAASRAEVGRCRLGAFAIVVDGATCVRQHLTQRRWPDLLGSATERHPSQTDPCRRAPGRLHGSSVTLIEVAPEATRSCPSGSAEGDTCWSDDLLIRGRCPACAPSACARPRAV